MKTVLDFSLASGGRFYVGMDGQPSAEEVQDIAELTSILVEALRRGYGRVADPGPEQAASASGEPKPTSEESSKVADALTAHSTGSTDAA